MAEMTGQRREETVFPQGPSALAGHVVPFAGWLAVILLLQVLEHFNICPRSLYPWSYAVKSVACAALFLLFKPWRFYPAFQWRHTGIALGAGVLVAVIWILPETPLFGRWCPAGLEFYHRWLIMMPGALPDYFDPALFPALPAGHLSWAYSPTEAGWGLTVMKLLGSAVVIAVIEEFFFRGFLYRWLRRASFWEVPLSAFDAQAFWTVVAVFGLEHDRWLAGCAAGAVYGWVAIRTGGVWASALAHGLTNFLLGVYVIVSRQYGFW